MFFSKHLIACVVSLFTVASASPTVLVARNSDATTNLAVCSAVNFGGTCITIPVSAGSQCINLTGGLTILNKEISSAVIPGGFICTFFEDSGCLSAGSSQTDEIALQGGSYANFAKLPGIVGTQSFNDLTSSIVCSSI